MPKETIFSRRKLIAEPDVRDLRDREYRPALIPLPQARIPGPGKLHIRDQGESSACTGFALAGVIDAQSGKPPVSTRMLYVMARLHDDLPDAEHKGATLRGALKGFFNNGACPEDVAKFDPSKDARDFTLTSELAELARSVSLGAYFRLNHEINDYHTAIIEAGAVLVSAKIHTGWAKPEDGKIAPRGLFRGRHAFAIVGYDEEGFLVQNSWGERWSQFAGLDGVARWSYEDWAENVEDAWVMRLAISSSRAFSYKFANAHKDFRKDDSSGPAASGAPLKPRRQDILGHFLHIDDGDLVTTGRYPHQEPEDIAACAKMPADKRRSAAACMPRDIGGMCARIAGMADKGEIQHLMFFAHGALLNSAAVAARAKAWLPIFLANGIYPVHLMWETSFNNEVSNIVHDLLDRVRERAGTDTAHLDDRLEAMARPLGRKLWRGLKETAELSLARSSHGGMAMAQILHAAPGLKLHFSAQSAGVLMFRWALKLAASEQRTFETGFLMAPACTTKFYETELAKNYLDRTVKRIVQYSLIDRRERADTVGVYGKSLLYLVANAIEEEPGEAILGLERDIEGLGPHPAAKRDKKLHEIVYAGRHRTRCDATSHRGFESDRATMNDILRLVTGRELDRDKDFSQADVSEY